LEYKPTNIVDITIERTSDRDTFVPRIRRISQNWTKPPLALRSHEIANDRLQPQVIQWLSPMSFCGLRNGASLMRIVRGTLFTPGRFRFRFQYRRTDIRDVLSLMGYRDEGASRLAIVR